MSFQVTVLSGSVPGSGTAGPCGRRLWFSEQPPSCSSQRLHQFTLPLCGSGFLSPTLSPAFAVRGLSLAMLSPRCCPRAVLQLRRAGSALHHGDTARASPVAEHGLQWPWPVGFAAPGPVGSSGAEMGPVSPSWQAGSSPLSHREAPATGRLFTDGHSGR